MKITIDRFEGKYAICETEDRKMIEIEKERLPEGAKPGDSLVLNEDGMISYNADEGEKRKKRIEKLMEDMWYN